MIYRVASSLLLLLSLLPALGCDKATPVAPNGTVLTISANPSQIGLNGRSTITIVGRKPDGNPLNPGTEIRLSTDRGTIDSVVTTEEGGRATATFRADGRVGPAMITAMTGGNVMVMTTIQVGQAMGDRPTVIISASPSTIDVGETSTITVIARNADGTPIGAGQQVILTTTLGTLTNPRPTTRADGTATTTLQSGERAGTAEISAVVGSSEVMRTMVTIREEAGSISITPSAPTVDAPTGADDMEEVTFTVFVRNTEGDPLAGAVVNFETEVGDFENGDTVGVTNSSGAVTKTLVLNFEDVDDLEDGDTFTVTATTNGTTGTISATATVTIDK